ncbi:DUF1643 domain-containing protein [Chelatococcus sp. XZ-Ab1]|uniref:DUF1643 domain-containing protein n=1 Tax=Chelatococcus sp. XZ-Ab1 TaxID=3034027 RepID=UPI0023E40C21|nr:DUF1643 domain-containing protein [Chelatococcus sp. XZ-Ab1]
MKRAALISPCGLYRYRLTRHWDPDKAPLTFVMLNPSTADAEVDDRTIRRCMGFAERERAGGIVVVNLYAYRATKPSALRSAADPRGPENDSHLMDAIRAATGRPIVCAWGTNGDGASFIRKAQAKGAELVALGITKRGHPRHPLYVPSDEPLIPYPARQ